MTECLSVPDSLYPHSEGVWEGVGKVTRQEKKKMKIVHKKRILIHFCRDMNWYSFLFLPNIFLPQMSDSRHRMIEQHSRSCPSHHYSHPFPHFRLIAMHGTNPTSWFPVSERTTWKPCLRILQQFPALRAQCSVPLFLPAVEANHLFYGLLFLFDAGHTIFYGLIERCLW